VCVVCNVRFQYIFIMMIKGHFDDDQNKIIFCITIHVTQFHLDDRSDPPYEISHQAECVIYARCLFSINSLYTVLRILKVRHVRMKLLMSEVSEGSIRVLSESLFRAMLYR
jgi:hypothetical protein